MRMRRRQRPLINGYLHGQSDGFDGCCLDGELYGGGHGDQRDRLYNDTKNVVIPAGSASATITVTPIDDTASEGNETVVVTLSSSASYTLGSPSAATVTIADNDVVPPTGTVAETDAKAAEAATPDTSRSVGRV